MLARQFFGKENPLGRLLHLKGAAWEIVGVVGSVRRYQLDYGPQPGVYFARTCFPWQTTVVVRTKGPPFAVAPDVRRAVHEFDPDLPVAKLDTLEQTVADSLKVRKIMLVLLAIFALTALALACVGIYGVISYSVAQRTREVGIRVALGADSSRVVRLILGPGVRLVLIGLAIGILASLGAGLLIANQLYGVSQMDPLVMGSVAFLLLAVAAVASWLPARRASRVDPAIALRAE